MATATNKRINNPLLMTSDITATTQIGARSRSFSAHLVQSTCCSSGNFRFPPFPSLKFSRPIRATLAAACYRAKLSDRHATLTSAPSSALSLGMCICCVPIYLPTYLRAHYTCVLYFPTRAYAAELVWLGVAGSLAKT